MQTLRSQIVSAPARKDGFTRVELLVVLAITAVLMSLVLPGILTIREAARRNQAKSKLRELGILMQNRAGKNDGGGVTRMATNPAGSNAGNADEEIVLATVMAVFATLGAILAGLLITLIARYLNRRDGRVVSGVHDEEQSGSFFGRWFCPPSSSPF